MKTMHERPSGKIALITGNSGGLGMHHCASSPIP
jgi:NAD(P)-dependent dehydrogenase (short-subunit alcohol dehydrogenase family)